jgi:hypothetical protein
MDRRVFVSVFVGVLAALVVHDISEALLARYYAYRAAERVNAVLRQIATAAAVPSGAPAPVGARAPTSYPDPLMEKLQAQERALSTLLPSQRCIGHTVVDVKGSSFVQHLNAAGRPVACTGRMANERVR